MKTSFVLGFAGLAAAQSITSLVASIPTCATAALISAIGKSGCSVTDYACQCSPANKSKIQAAATPDITAKCSGAEISQVLSITTKICNIALSGGGGASSAAPASSKAPASSMAAPTYTAPPASTPAPPASTPAPPASTPAPPAPPVSQITDGQPQATVPVAPITQITDGQVQATTPAAPIYTGAAAKVAGPVGGAVLLAAAAFAL